MTRVSILDILLYNQQVKEIAGSCPKCGAYYTLTQRDSFLEELVKKDPLLVGLQCLLCGVYFTPKTN